MKSSVFQISVLGLAVILLMGGCLMISGTFVIVEPFSFTTQTGFYHYYVDITDEKDWEDHKEDIDDVDLVGFDMYFTNNEDFDVTFNVYLAPGGDDALGSPDEVTADGSGAVKVLSNITLPTGQTHVTYGESFAYLTNVDALKKLVKAGQFHYYGVSDGGTDDGYKVDKGKVIVTFSASK
jgi:hypothetical protein